MYKIAFSGVAGSGKTSILSEVKKILSFKFRVEDVPDLYLNSPFDFDHKAGFVSQFFFLSNQINEENIRTLNNPDYLLCDGSVLDHWLEWQKSLAGKKADAQTKERNTLLKSLYSFWLPSYTMVFRMRIDAKELEMRMPQSGLRAFEPENFKLTDELYNHVIQVERIHVIDIWNHHSIDESAQEVLKKIAELKLI